MGTILLILILEETLLGFLHLVWWLKDSHFIEFSMLRRVWPSFPSFFGASIRKRCWTLPKVFSKSIEMRMWFVLKPIHVLCYIYWFADLVTLAFLRTNKLEHYVQILYTKKCIDLKTRPDKMGQQVRRLPVQTWWSKFHF